VKRHNVDRFLNCAFTLLKQAGGTTLAIGGGVNTAETLRVSVRCVDNLSDRVTSVYESIARMIQRRIVIEPNTTVRQWGHGFLVEVDFPNTDPARIRLYMSATALLVLAPIQGNGMSSWLFRYIRFETPIDATDVLANFEKGILRISATMSNFYNPHETHGMTENFSAKNGECTQKSILPRAESCGTSRAFPNVIRHARI